MCVKTLIIFVTLSVVSGRDSQLEQDCHILQSLDDVMNRLSRAESEIANTKSNLVNAETQVTNLRSSLTSTETQVTNLKSSLVTADNKIDQQATEIATLQDSLRSADTKIDQQATEIATLQYSLRTRVATKPTVAFLVNGIKEQPTLNKIITFENVVENVGGGYNINSSCFTAPAPGVYWFSATLCTLSNRHMYLSIFKRSSVVSRVYIHDADHIDCGTVKAISKLEVGYEVCLKSQRTQSTDPVWSESYTYQNNFMGAIIN